MRWGTKLVLGLLAGLAALGLAACSQGERIRVYIEPTYERDRLEEILALHPEVVFVYPGTEDISLRVEAVREEAGVRRIPRASIRAHARKTGYKAFAVAEFLPVHNDRGGRARWASSFDGGVREDDVADILFEVVREAARENPRPRQRSLAQLLAAFHSPTDAD
ncbi:MAG: hypothetical protein HYY26_00790 [Acidobacteria bacterium]|nr:hypothetical protein [Acidobacteriota bacterium]